MPASGVAEMTKTTRLASVGELTVVRLACRNKGCHTIVEFNLAKIWEQGPQLTRETKCPGCNRYFTAGYGDEENPLYALAKAIRGLNYMQENNFDVQFPLDEAE
jgi:hypothetical protein